MDVNIGRKRFRKGRIRKARSWVVAISAMGVLVAYSAGPSRAVTLAWTQPKSVAAVNQVQNPDQAVAQRFDIPAGPLQTVLESFQAATGWKVRTPSAEMLRVASPGVTGLHTPEKALARLLAGTGISFQIDGLKTATLEIHAQSESVEVRENAGNQVSSP